MARTPCRGESKQPMLPRTAWPLPGTLAARFLPLQAVHAAFLVLLAIAGGTAPAQEDKPERSTSSAAPSGEASDAGAAVESALGLADSREGGGLWAAIRKLESLGKSAEPALRSKLLRASERGQLACAKVLLGIGGE